MLRSTIRTTLLMALAVMLAASWGAAQESAQRSYDNNGPVEYRGNVRIDRYLDVEVWPGHSDGEYFVGDDIVLSFRASRDCFVAIYSIDSRGRVNLLFPSSPSEDNFILGNETYQIPGAGDDYDLVVTGPEGFEHVQIIASRERFPIPNWYSNSGLVSDWDDRYDFMDYLNGKYFVRYDGQSFAYDRAVIFVNEWEEYYYRPIYRPYYPDWTIVGNAYIDYGWGYSVYVNGVYWGCTPLYLPRIAIGWHTITLYDRHGYCWESDIHVSRRNTVVLNKTIIHTSPTVKSKYREVRQSAYRDPVKAGYTNFKTQDQVVKSITSKSTRSGGSGAALSKGTRGTTSTSTFQPERKYVRGNTTVKKTSRGYETDVSARAKSRSGTTRQATRAKTSTESRYSDETRSRARSATGGSTSGYRKSSGSNSGSSGEAKSSRRSGSSSGFYQKKSGSSRSSSGSRKATVKKQTTTKRSSGTSSGRKSSSGSTVKKSGSSKGSSSSGTVKRSSGGSSKSSGSVRSSGSSRKSQPSSKGGSKRSSGGSKDKSGR